MIDEASVIQFLTSRFDDVQGVWLFGSEAKGQADKESDIDLAVLFPVERDKLAMWDAAQDLSVALHRDVDLVDLRQASTVLQYQIVSTGRCIYSADNLVTENFMNFVWVEYLDFNELRRPILEDIFKRGSIYGR